ncbi:MAG TPA: hypothetical protein DCG57_15900 [Candidatus Riflebacteria bacterium]|nr:hypothetical protein [Candidatus Riflebacteria bacterium]
MKTAKACQRSSKLVEVAGGQRRFLITAEGEGKMCEMLPNIPGKSYIVHDRLQISSAESISTQIQLGGANK